MKALSRLVFIFKILTTMKKNVFKMALALCIMFALGGGNLQNFSETKSLIKNTLSLDKVEYFAKVIPPIRPTGPKKLVQEIPDIDLQIQKI